MKRFPLLSLPTFAIALVFGSCAQRRTVPFNEAAFSHYAGSGSGSITGTARLKTAENNIVTAGDCKAMVELMPVNAYTEEIVAKTYRTIGMLTPPDPRFKKYVRETSTDGAGHFTFSHVPAGTYFVGCDLVWPSPTTSTDSNGSATTDFISRWIYKKISVGNGQTARVENWENAE